MDARILLVEDDADLRDTMAGALGADGHDVEVSADGHEALRALAARDHDLVVLDIALGAGPDGVEVCRRLRRVDSDMYVMMLTARDDEPDIVLALDAGADDYVVKPVGVAELRSRVTAALRRMRGASAQRADGADGIDGDLRHAALVLDRSSRRVSVGSSALALTPSEFALLEALLVAAGAVRSRTQLLQAVYGDESYRDPRGIDVHVHNLRDKLEHAGGDPQWIVTVRGTGYRLAP